MTDTTHGSLTSGATPAEIRTDIAPLLDFQKTGISSPELERLIETSLIPHLMNYGEPTFQSMFNAEPDPAALIGAEIALHHNQGVTNWQVSPGGAMLEEGCGQALCRLFDLGAGADATFMYSGTYANQQALYMALHRHAERRGVDLALAGLAAFDDPTRLAVLVSEDAHFSLRHAVRMLGLGESSLIRLPVDRQRRIDLSQTSRIMDDLAGSRDIVCLVATAGTTSTGAVDPIARLADLAEECGAWLHVDGAYGYAYKLVPQTAALFAGDRHADSITWDPHKQLGVPIPNSVLFVRDRLDFARMALFSGYFNRVDDPMPNPGLKSPPSTRPMSALPLVAAIRGRGLAALTAGLAAPLTAISELADYIRSQPEIELCHEPDTGILCFRATPASWPTASLSELQQALCDRIMESGARSVSVTNLDGNVVLRLVSVSTQTSFADLCETVQVIQRMATGMAKDRADHGQ